MAGLNPTPSLDDPSTWDDAAQPGAQNDNPSSTNNQIDSTLSDQTGENPDDPSTWGAVEPPVSTAQKLEAFGGAAVKAGVQGMADVRAGQAGARVMAPAGEAIGGPVVGAIAGAVGAVGGVAASEYAGSQAQKAIQVRLSSGVAVGFDNYQDVPLELRPWVVAGEAMGGSLGFATLPLSMAGSGARLTVPALSADMSTWQALTTPSVYRATAARAINTMVNTAANSPLGFMFNEGRFGLTAGAYGAYAASVHPDSPWRIATAEAIGGTLTPTRWLGFLLGKFATPVSAIAKTVLGPLGDTAAGNIPIIGKMLKAPAAAVQKGAQDFLGRVTTAYEEDPADIAKRLLDPNGPTGLYSAAKANSPALAKLQNTLASYSSQFGDAARDATVNGLGQLQQQIDDLRKVGTPEALKLAADMKQQFDEGQIGQTLNNATNDALQAANDYLPTGAADTSAYAQKAAGIIGNAQDSVRDVSEEMYTRLANGPYKVSIGTQGFEDAVNDVQRNHMLSTEALEPIVGDFYGLVSKRIGLDQQIYAMDRGGAVAPENQAAYMDLLKQKQDLGETTFKEMNILHSRVLGLIRDLREGSQSRSPNPELAYAYGKIAEGIQQDRNGALADDSAGQQLLSDANGWTKKMYDVFYRTFVGNVIGQTAAGGDRMPPELVLENAYAGGGAGAAVKSNALSEAARMGDQAQALMGQSLSDAQSRYFAQMQQTQQDALRAVAGSVRNNSTGRVDAGALADWRKTHAQVLENFPELNSQLATTQRAQEYLDATQSDTQKTLRDIQTGSAATKLLGYQDPADRIQEIMTTSKQPDKDLQDVVQLAAGANDGGAASEGLQNSVYSWLIKQASPGGKFSFQKYNEILNSPFTPSSPMSVADVLVKSGAVQHSSMYGLQKWLGRAAQLEGQLGDTSQIDQGLPISGKQNLITGPIKDFVVRFAGARTANAVARATVGVGGTSLQTANLGTRVARSIFDQVPNAKVREVLMQASKDPEMMADLMQGVKPLKPKDAMRWSLQMNAYLAKAGVWGWQANSWDNRNNADDNNQ